MPGIPGTAGKRSRQRSEDRAGVCVEQPGLLALHALAGDDLARQGGGRGMLALELADTLARWVNP